MSNQSKADAKISRVIPAVKFTKACLIVYSTFSLPKVHAQVVSNGNRPSKNGKIAFMFVMNLVTSSQLTLNISKDI